jgi:F0F1-type ATP synthase membrane subunit b/b'
MMAAPLAQYLADFGSSLKPGEAPQGRGRAPAIQPLRAIIESPVEKIEEALARGREQGAAAARAEYEAKLAEERARAAAALAEARRAWVAEEGETLAAKLSVSMRELTTMLADSLARILRPFLVDALRQQVVDGLLEKLGVLLAHDRDIVLRISGPQDLLDSLREKLGSFPASIDYIPTDDADVRVVANQTVIETQLQAWFQRIGAGLG